MNAFSKRYFVWICLIFLAFSLLSYKYPGLIIFLIFSAALGVAYLILRHFRPKVKNLALVCILLAVASLLGALNSTVDLYKKDNLVRKYDGEHEMKGYVAEVLSDESFMGEFVVRIEEVDGERASFTAVIVTEYQSELMRGDFFDITCTATALEDYEGADYLKSIHLGEYALACVISSDDEIRYLDGEFRIELLFSSLNRRLSAKLRQIIGGSSGSLASALLLGNRGLLSQDIIRDFKRAGVYHMLSLSGLHVAILIGIFEYMLRKLYVPKSVRIAFLALLSLFYIALTGFLPSACRSMLMLWAVYLSFAAARPSDSMTSLLLAVTIIVIITPSAVKDIGLLLSFLSTFGVIAALMICDRIDFPEAGRRERLKKMAIRALKSLVSALVISICTFVITLPVLMIYFGEVSLATFISNIFVGTICEGFMILSLVTLVMPMGTEISAFCGEITHNFGEFMMSIVSKLADADGVMLSLAYPGIEYLVWGLFIASMVLFAIKVPKKRFLAIPCILFAVLMCVCVASYKDMRDDFVRTEYISSDALVITSSDEVYICDMSSGRYGALYESVAIAKENCFTEIDGVVLTHYHSYHVISLQKLAKSVKLDRVLLPVPQNAEEGTTLRAIVRVMKENGVDAYVYDTEKALELAGGRLNISKRVYSNGYSHPSVALSYEFADERVTLIQGPYFGTHLEGGGYFDAFIKDSDYLVFGSDGRRPKESFRLFPLLKEDCEISFSDYETLALSDYESYLDSMKIYFNVLYKKYDLK